MLRSYQLTEDFRWSLSKKYEVKMLHMKTTELVQGSSSVIAATPTDVF